MPACSNHTYARPANDSINITLQLELLPHNQTFLIFKCALNAQKFILKVKRIQV